MYLKYKILIAILIACLGYFWYKSNNNQDSNDYKIISHEIQRLNKVIVLDQNFSEFYTHKNSLLGDNSIGNLVDLDDKKIVLHITAKAQAVYDMKKMEIEIDSINKIVKINKIPQVEIQVFPNVEIFHLDQGLLNRYSESEMKKITQQAKNKIIDQAQKSDLKNQAKKQLIENFKDLLFFTKTYNWKIVDNSDKTISLFDD